ncbi:DEAD/DEAH box helicase [Schaalia suimastitidis]|uniref:DEAD/DEAH box helicase n=1 Tax=Schaalia suimastitidis TaxID=121163 RepID=UPI00041E5976|nr:DEAD/DEAH box helicase [Schaalia suimastitidis]
MHTPTSLRATIATLEDADIMAKVGPATWARGGAHFRNNKVIDIRDGDDGRICGRIRATGLTYTAWIAPGVLTPTLTCACTLGQDCAHAVALLLAVRAYEREQRDVGPQWREALSALIGGPSGARGEAMALLVDTCGAQGAWGSNGADNGSAHQRGSEKLGHIWLTPLRPGKHREWVTKRATWPDIVTEQWTSVVDDLNPTHVALLREGYRRSRDGTKWRSRSDVALQDLGYEAWNWLRSLERAGITLLTRIDPPVPLTLSQSTWEMSLDAAICDGNLLLSPVATLGDTVVSQALIAAESGLVVLDGGETLARVAHNDIISQWDSQAMTIPAADIADFRATWLHSLRTHIRVLSRDGSCPQDHETEVRLVATLRINESKNLLIRWWSEYDIAGQWQRAPYDRQTVEPAVRTIAARIERRGRGICPADLWPAMLTNDEIPGWKICRYIDEVVHRIDDTHLVWDIADEVTQMAANEPQTVTIGIALDETAERDWFDLKARIFVGGHELEFADVLRALSQGHSHIYVAGHWVSLDGPRITHLRYLLEQAAQLTDSNPHHPRIHTLHTGLWEELSQAADRVDAAHSWRQRLEGLSVDTDSAALPVDACVSEILRPYQKDGHRWLSSRATLGLGGILADDMGLGKTLQLLSAISALKTQGCVGGSAGPVLVVAPTSVLGTWQAETQRFFPDLRLALVSSTRQHDEIAPVLQEVDIIVTSYTIMRLQAKIWAAQPLAGLILDEAQAAKNPATAIHKSLRGLNVGWCFAVTGTPVENSLLDLWSILQLTCPGLLPGRKIFDAVFRKPVEAGSTQQLKRLHTLTAPFLLRRTKELVATDLPDKIEQVVRVELGTEHRRIYEQYLARERSRLLGLMDNFGKHRIDVLASLTRLRQLALDPALVDSALTSVGSAKIEYLADQLDEIVPRGHQVLVFSQFTSFLERIRHVVERRGHRVVQLDGSTRNRVSVIDEFRKGKADVFLISLKAGGTGLTLTEADYVFVMDPWWNPAAEEQAVDRAHRIGQSKKVNVYRLAAAETIEEKVLALQEKKRKLVSAVVDDVPHASRITVADLRRLLDEA